LAVIVELLELVDVTPLEVEADDVDASCGRASELATVDAEFAICCVLVAMGEMADIGFVLSCC